MTAKQWTQSNPIETHLITILIVLLIVGTVFTILISRYGDKVDETHRGTEFLIEMVNKMKNDTTDNG